MLPELTRLFCHECTNLTEIPPDLLELIDFYCAGCIWIEKQNPSFNFNMEKLKRLQRFCRNNLKYWRFRRWIKSKEFAEWFYSPNQWGGKVAKLNIQKMFRDKWFHVCI